ncbi:tyrosine-type recombinase/integrase [Oceanibaculum indicum]|uniref:Integrase n=1 Tax=Oceanibaculum indicum TaxID=526216 RepID=A0A420WR16_9PROT|nr:integrase arm-type DNA-binding domain-containing protein [Oceanibaculum indicum]RKQ73474.1 integrase [Oceanibaculum indicum]
MGNLTARKVETAKVGRYGDGNGLWLHVGKNGARSWVFRYRRDGKSREMGLGPVAVVSLAEARQKALDARRQLFEGIDPLAARNAAMLATRAQQKATTTFQQATERFIGSNEAAWRNDKHRQQWRNTLATYAYPHFGDLSVAAVDTDLVLKALEPIWTEKPETASRLRQRIERVLDWATAREMRKGENPARWRGHLQNVLPSHAKVRKVQHHAALPYDQLPAFMTELAGQAGISARALEMAILTATRTGEVIGARWPEIDLEAAVWTIPAERMKAGKEHRVPLSRYAVGILTDLKKHADSADGHVFPGMKKGKPLSNMAMLATLKRMDRADLTAHGFRSTFRDWAAERTGYPAEVAEMALAHTISSKVEAAYRRGDLFEKRRRMMEDWASFATTPGPIGEVVNIRR